MLENIWDIGGLAWEVPLLPLWLLWRDDVQLNDGVVNELGGSVTFKDCLSSVAAVSSTVTFYEPVSHVSILPSI